MMGQDTQLLILGLGNPLFGDDGIGIAAIERLQSGWSWPRGVHLVDGGTMGLALVPLLQDAEQAILLDAVRADGAAGTLVRLCGPEVPHRLPQRMSPHEIGVVDLMFGTRILGRCPQPLVLLGLIPERLDYGLRRSPSVDAALEALVAAAVGEAAELGFYARPKKEQ